MSGFLGPGHSTGIITGMAWMIITFACVYTVGIAAMAYTMGNAEAYVDYWAAEKRDCTKREMRQFVNQGFLFFSGSGEVTTREVCVEWIVRR